LDGRREDSGTERKTMKNEGRNGRKTEKKQSNLNGTKTNKVDNATELYTYFMNYIKYACK